MSVLENRARVGATIIGFEEGPNGFDFPILITFDCTIDEVHEASSNVTAHPVEGGQNISDHVQNKPRTVRMGVEHSATPLVQAATPNRVSAAHETLLEIHRAREAVRVVTTLEDYGSLVLTRYSVQRDSRTGQALRASLEWQEVTIVNPETVAIPASILKEPQRASGKSKDRPPKQNEGQANGAEREKGSTILDALF